MQFSYKLKLLLVPLLLAACAATSETRRIDFEDDDTAALLGTGEYYPGDEDEYGFIAGGAYFSNYYMPDWNYWSDFALSRVNDTVTEGLANQFAVYTPGTGVGGGGTYAVSFAYGSRPTITLPCERAIVRQIRLNNTTYTALSMLNGDSFAKKFGGRDGTDPDWLMVTITGWDAAGNETGSVDFMLADYRFDDPADDYIVDAWTTVDLTPLGDQVASLTFAVSGSDVGAWGLNTPGYFALDDLEYIPVRSGLDATFDNVELAGSYELPDGSGFTDLDVRFGNTFTDWGYGITSWDGFCRSAVCETNIANYNNQYAVWTPGHDVSTNGNYAVFYQPWSSYEQISFPRQAYVKGFYVANTTYAALSIRDGLNGCKQFAAGDWFKLTIHAADTDGEDLGSTDVYLARDGEILSDWTWVDLTGFGPAVKTLDFSLSSTDNGDWGMNTPAYFAMDNLSYVYTFSAGSPEWNGNDTDAGVPGFVGGEALGEVDGATLNPAFAGWATAVADYSPAPGVASDDQFTHNDWTVATRALGPATGDNFDIVSLGDLDASQLATNAVPGSITLSFATPIADKAGPDFAVFENAYVVSGTDGNVFAEFGYVEVSSDGIHFTRFPSTYIDLGLGTDNGRGYANVDVRGAHNLCGKHVNAYGTSFGTPFDLSELATSTDAVNGTLDLSNVTHVRIVDIPGDGTYKDDCDPSNGILDAWVTWSSGGVDLDAVGVLNSSAASRIDLKVTGPGEVSPLGYPNSYVSVPHGDDVTFTFTPSNGCAIASVTLDGVPQALSGDTLTLTDLQHDHEIAVAFYLAGGTTSEGVPYAWLLENGAMDAATIAAAGSIELAAEAAAASDDDGDGQCNAVEYFGGTDPADAGDSFRIIGFDQGAKACTITWLGGTSGSALPFEVVVRTNLSANVPAEKTVEIPSRSVTGTNTWTDVSPITIQRFYQIRVGETPE